MRRLALGTAVLAALVLAVPAGPAGADLPAATRRLAADPSTTTTTPVKHFVTVMQEMRSFDSYFGTYPGADGIPDDVCMPAPPASGDPCVEPFAIGNQRSRRLQDDRATFAAQYANGAMNGFVTAQSTRGVTNPLPMAHYDGNQLPYYWSLARNYVLFDRYFSSAGAGSAANHLFWVAATSGGSTSVPTGSVDLTTIFDRLQDKGVSWKFYVQDYDPSVTGRTAAAGSTQVERVPLLGMSRFLDDPELARHIVPIDEYYDDLGRDELPAVAYIVPSGSSETPPASVTNGQAFVRNLVAGLKRSRAWSSSALMLSYADWGGWYDHVAPPQIDDVGLGFRVPALLVSPFARRGAIDHTQLEHSSIPAFIEANWGLAPLATRDRAATGLAGALDFTQRPRIPQLGLESGRSTAVEAGEVGIIYPAYGGAALLGAAVVVFAVVAGRRRRRRHQEVVLP